MHTDDEDGVALREPADVLDYLGRDDKWFLAGGKGACFAPCFPQWLDAPGFWDEAFLADVPLDRLFTVFFVEAGQTRPLRLQRVGPRRWTPAALTQEWEGEGGWRIREDKIVTARNTFVSRLTVTQQEEIARALHVLVWSVQERRLLGEDALGATVATPERWGDRLLFRHRVQGTEASGEVTVALGTSYPAASTALHLAERSETQPLWDLSPFPEKFQHGRLASEDKSETGWEPSGFLHLSLHSVLEVQPSAAAAIMVGAAAAFDPDEALAQLNADVASRDPLAQSRADWSEYFSSVPWFTCSDPHLQKYYWYRWYGLRLSTVAVCTPTYPHPCVFEGIGMFRCHITYSAQCHIREASWMHDPALARGSVLNFVANQERDGQYPGHVWTYRAAPGAFYHADWGGPLLQLQALHPDAAFLETAYASLCRYAEHFEKTRDPDGVHLYDVIDQNETGQEYMSRYFFASAEADDWRPFRLKGADATVYQYVLQKSLAEAATRLGRPEAEQNVWRRKAEATQRAVREFMWDDDRALFFDTAAGDPARLSPFATAVGFYPFLTDIAERRHLRALNCHLFNDREFWTDYPVPASPQDDPYFSAEAEWRGKRTNCPWNGRTWPMTNSHVCDALARAARTLAPVLKPQACELLMRAVRLMFWEGDVNRPNCFEHYNPFTGEPSAYRGVDDYMHSWVVDLILRHVVGVQPPEEGGTLVVDPLPFLLDRFEARNILIRGHQVDVSWQEGTLTVCVDGQICAQSRGRESLTVPLSASPVG